MLRRFGPRNDGANTTPTLPLSGEGSAPSEWLQIKTTRALAEHLDLAVERHQTGLHRHHGVMLLHLPAEFQQHRAMGLGLELRSGNTGGTVGDLGGAAIAMVEGDDLGDVVQLNRRGEIVKERLAPVLEGRRDHTDGGAGN